MSTSIRRRLERVAEAISGHSAGCTCDGQGSVRVIRYVGPGDPPQEPEAARAPVRSCPQHPTRIIRFERFDRVKGEYVECDRKQRAGVGINRSWTTLTMESLESPHALSSQRRVRSLGLQSRRTAEYEQQLGNTGECSANRAVAEHNGHHRNDEAKDGR